jgi:hypothetical protein
MLGYVERNPVVLHVVFDSSHDNESSAALNASDLTTGILRTIILWGDSRQVKSPRPVNADRGLAEEETV